MKTKPDRILCVSVFAVGLFCLVAGTLQLTGTLVHLDHYPSSPFWKSDAAMYAILLIPEVLIFLYIALRLYGELKSVWRMILAVVAYPAIGLAWAVIIAICSDSYLGAILGYGSFFAAIAVPIILSIVGLMKKRTEMTLVLFMIFNLLYTMYAFALYSLSYWKIDNAVQLSIYFILPLMLLLSADLALQYRLAPNRET